MTGILKLAKVTNLDFGVNGSSVRTGGPLLLRTCFFLTGGVAFFLF